MLFSYFMNREIRKSCFADTLQSTLVNVEMNLNEIDRLYNEKEISEKYVEMDMERAFYELEINLSILAIVLRKMDENRYIHIDSALRYDLNSLIHSNRFEYHNGSLSAYSAKGEEILQLDNILKFARQVIKEDEK